MNKHALLNIKNLVTFWEKASAPFQGYFSGETFSYCRISNSDWPNRVWLEQELDEDVLKEIRELIISSPVGLSFSHWDNIESTNYKLIEQSGFEQKSTQLGMSMQLNQKFKQEQRLTFENVNRVEQAKIWTDLYPQSFKYNISLEILNRTCDKINYYIIHLDNAPIGTVITYQTENAIGIHGLGIVPEMRKRGFAEETMSYILNKAIDNQVEYAYLQASELGKNIYLNMGFVMDFIMRNYIKYAKDRLLV
nr:GNAT family N-acetyltransferase [Pedobacter panaciterrae]